MSKEYERNLKRWRARRAQMTVLRAKGWTLQAIADRFDITRQRAGQILGKRQ